MAATQSLTVDVTLLQSLEFLQTFSLGNEVTHHLKEADGALGGPLGMPNSRTDGFCKDT